jgi:hypothetical protein
MLTMEMGAFIFAYHGLHIPDGEHQGKLKIFPIQNSSLSLSSGKLEINKV